MDIINTFAVPGETATYNTNHFSTQIVYDKIYAPCVDDRTFVNRDLMSMTVQAERGIRCSDTSNKQFDVFEQKEALDWVNHSAKPMANFTSKIIPYGSLKDFDPKKLETQSKWHYNGVPDCKIQEGGEEVIIHHTVTSSNDRNSDRIAMMREVTDVSTKESIAYTGRGDTEDKAIEQITFIFRNEMEKRRLFGTDQGLKHIKGNKFELTYMITNLMSSRVFHLPFPLNQFDEKKSILDEREVLANLSSKTLKINYLNNEYEVKISPFYFNQDFNFMTRFSVPCIQKNNNSAEYHRLIKHIRKEDPNIAKKLTKKLLTKRPPWRFKPEEELLYRDLIFKYLKIPIVYHCKSSTDRTGIAVALSTAAKGYINHTPAIPLIKDRLILKDTRFKQLFAANIPSCHQVTRNSRSANGIIRGSRQLPNLIGFNWGGNTPIRNNIAIRLLPGDYKKGGKFNTEGKKLLILKGMKMHYTTPDTYPFGYREG